MAITTQTQLADAMRGGQTVSFIWGTTSSFPRMQSGIFSVPVSPSGGVLAGTSTAAGVVPTSATAGMPTIRSFNGNAGYIAQVDAKTHPQTGGTRLYLCDMLFKAGAYAFNADVTLAGQPSYAARLPNTNYSGLMLAWQVVTAFTGTVSLSVTYTNQDGVAGQIATTSSNAPGIGVSGILLLQSGDTGVQKIDRVVATGATAGTFNVFVLRPILNWGCGPQRGYKRTYGPVEIGLPIVYDTSALVIFHTYNGGSFSGPAEVRLLIADG